MFERAVKFALGQLLTAKGWALLQSWLLHLVCQLDWYPLACLGAEQVSR